MRTDRFRILCIAYRLQGAALLLYGAAAAEFQAIGVVVLPLFEFFPHVKMAVGWRRASWQGLLESAFGV
ncbi:MAG: hypothetical protein RL180_853 [Pseudomonadota bacterium]|jgi:hypothetical protein